MVALENGNNSTEMKKTEKKTKMCSCVDCFASK